MQSKIYGYLSSEESLGTVDGPGVRYVIFMQGCSLRCLYCHNPETWAMNGGYKVTPKEIITKIERYKPYFGKDGGVTFSGGEPLLQSEFLLECLKLCKEKNIHTTLDTSGVGEGNYEKILQWVDLVILDVKAVDEEEYRTITGRDMSNFNNFLETCQKLGNKLWIRQVVVPNLNDDEKHMCKLAKFLKNVKNIEKIELLPYKTLGESKYKTLGINYRLAGTPEMDEVKCNELEKQLKLLMGE